MKKHLRIPSPFQPTNKLHHRSWDFLVKEGLVGFYHPDADAKLAHGLLKDPRAKETIEASAMAAEPPSFIAYYVKNLGLPCTAEAVKRYCFYYWDLKRVDSHELRALLRMRWEYLRYQKNDLSVDQRRQLSALEKTRHRDARNMIANMPITPMAGLLNRLRMGIMPAKVELARLANATRIASTVRAYEASTFGGPRSGEEARDFALVSKMMTELINELGSPDIELQKELHQLAIDTEHGAVPLLAELSEGSHTTDLQPSTTEISDVEAESAE